LQRIMKKVHVDPGICGFKCSIKAEKADGQIVRLTIESECKQIQKLAEAAKEMGLRDVVGKPFGQSGLVSMAGQCKLHAACPIPTACIKAAEAELGMALPRPVTIEFLEE